MVAWSVAAFNTPLKLDKFSKYSPRMSKGGVFKKLWSQTACFSSVQDGNCALRQAHVSSITFLISFPSCFWKSSTAALIGYVMYVYISSINSCYPWQMSHAGNYQFTEHWNKQLPPNHLHWVRWWWSGADIGANCNKLLKLVISMGVVGVVVVGGVASVSVCVAMSRFQQGTYYCLKCLVIRYAFYCMQIKTMATCSQL